MADLKHGIDPSFFEYKLSAHEVLSGGAVVIDHLDPGQLAEEPEAIFSVHPGAPIPDILGPEFTRAIRLAQQRHPHRRLDVSAVKDTLIASDPNSISTSRLGIHKDGFEDGFYVASSDEPTVFYDDDGTNPQQAKPGDLVYVPPECDHSSPIPDNDGERTRIKIIPQRPFDDARQPHKLPLPGVRFS